MPMAPSDIERVVRLCGYGDVAVELRTIGAALLDYLLAYFGPAEVDHVQMYLAIIAIAEPEGHGPEWRRRLCWFLGVPPGPELCEAP